MGHHHGGYAICLQFGIAKTKAAIRVAMGWLACSEEEGRRYLTSRSLSSESVEAKFEQPELAHILGRNTKYYNSILGHP